LTSKPQNIKSLTTNPDRRRKGVGKIFRSLSAPSSVVTVMMFVMLATVLVLGLTEGFCWFVGDVWFEVSNTLIFEKGYGFGV
jgi:hypothetical protein